MRLVDQQFQSFTSVHQLVYAMHHDILELIDLLVDVVDGGVHARVMVFHMVIDDKREISL